MVARYHCNEMESEVMSEEPDGEWVSYHDVKDVLDMRAHENPVVTCQDGHWLPARYWGEGCPICELIYRAMIALEDGEWAYLESRDKFEDALKNAMRMTKK